MYAIALLVDIFVNIVVDSIASAGIVFTGKQKLTCTLYTIIRGKRVNYNVVKVVSKGNI